MISSKRVDVLPHKWSDVTLRFILNLVSFGAQFSDNPGDMNHVPGDHGIVQDRKTTLKSPVQAVFSSPNPTFCYPTFPGLPCTPPPPPTFPGTVLFAGAAPQQVVGVTQINIEIPDNAVVGTAVPPGLQSTLFNFSLTVAIK